MIAPRRFVGSDHPKRHALGCALVTCWSVPEDEFSILSQALLPAVAPARAGYLPQRQTSPTPRAVVPAT